MAFSIDRQLLQVYTLLPPSLGAGTVYTTNNAGAFVAVPPPPVTIPGVTVSLVQTSSATAPLTWSSTVPVATAPGSLLVSPSSGSNTYAALPPPATSNQVLTYNTNATPTNLQWVDPFPKTSVTGSLFVSDGTNGVFVLPPGFDGQVLTVSSSATTIVEWVTPAQQQILTNTVITSTIATLVDAFAVNVGSSIQYATNNYFFVEGKAVMKSNAVGLALNGAAYAIQSLFKKEGDNIIENPDATNGESRLTFEDEVDTNPQEGVGFDAHFSSDSTFIYFQVQQPTTATMSYTWFCTLSLMAV